MLALTLLLAAAPSIVVVTDAPAERDAAATRAAAAATAWLQASGKAAARLHEAPVPKPCAEAPGCPERPAADALLRVSLEGDGAVALSLLDARGAALAREAVRVEDAALLDAALAPALERLVAALPPAPATGGGAGGGGGGAATVVDEGGGPWPWVVGGLGVCGGLCGLSLVTAIGYAFVVSAEQAGQAAGDSCGAALGEVCVAPFAALGDAVSACGDAGRGLGDACNGIGSCALVAPAPGAAGGVLVPGLTTPVPTEEGAAMAY